MRCYPYKYVVFASRMFIHFSGLTVVKCVGNILRNAFFGGIRGATYTLFVGAGIGLLLWATGAAFTYSWVDLPICGAVFGFVVGGIGGVLHGAVLAAASKPVPVQFVLHFAAMIVAMTCGARIGSAIFPYDDRALVFGFFGALGALIGATAAVFGGARSADIGGRESGCRSPR